MHRSPRFGPTRAQTRGALPPHRPTAVNKYPVVRPTLFPLGRPSKRMQRGLPSQLDDEHAPFRDPAPARASFWRIPNGIFVRDIRGDSSTGRQRSYVCLLRDRTFANPAQPMSRGVDTNSNRATRQHGRTQRWRRPSARQRLRTEEATLADRARGLPYETVHPQPRKAERRVSLP